MAFPLELFVGDGATVGAGATVIQESAVPPGGLKIQLKVFGGFDPVSGDGVSSMIGLQWGQGGSWESLAVGGHGFFEKTFIDRVLIGDGTKRFRLIRINRSPTAKNIYAWATLA
jgi:hypothetical protein